MIAGLASRKTIEDWNEPIDAAFVGINRHATIEAVSALRACDAGGAVCFASGFTEATAEDPSSADLQEELVVAAGEMPILGPNCYGFVNALDRVAIWPDQHGLLSVDRGVAILTQSSNIAINLTMQKRGLPIAAVITCGNMAQTSQAEIATSLLDDPRITAIGLHVEGFHDLRQWEALAKKAWGAKVPLIVLKSGASDLARHAAVSHTASLAGSDAGAQAFLDRMGIARLHDLPSFLETLKLLHVSGRLRSNRIASISCSGGEASLIADMAQGRNLVFPPLSTAQKQALNMELGPKVAVANPLDYHTYIWRDPDAMARTWAAMTGPDIDLTLSIVDYPHTDDRDWDCATQAAMDARQITKAPFSVVASLSELMPEDVASRLMQADVVPFHGLSEALAAVEAAAICRAPEAEPVLLPDETPDTCVLSEVTAKAELARFGLSVPQGRIVRDGVEAARAAQDLTAPLVVKAMGLAHKSEHGAVHLSLSPDAVAGTVAALGAAECLIEEMVPDAVAELLVGVVRDPAHGFVLTLAAGGVLTELLQDTVSLLVPASRHEVDAALSRLKIHRLLTGYRGRPAADMASIGDAVAAVQAYVIANARQLEEVEINPLICTPDGAVAVDALIRKAVT